MKTYKTYDEVRAANEAGGLLFFDPENMKMMRTELLDGPLGIWFVTSEQPFATLEREFALRRVEPNGYIETVAYHSRRELAVGHMIRLYNARCMRMRCLCYKRCNCLRTFKLCLYFRDLST